ncbi:tripartite motif-containing protein 59 isoform X3 [Patella vulgata]|uniref:tripartite motif-containing protein 59 isoform X3 n=1 Tax=Patella vulgata TaxID=6465 RepID=UPI00217FFBED|nr:tripartite motif-containing protein 59 isoform X3 [Patella vulgata]
MDTSEDVALVDQNEIEHFGLPDQEERQALSVLPTVDHDMTDGGNNPPALEEKLAQFQNDTVEDKDRDPVSVSECMSQLDKRRRNLIFDEERFEETFLKCMICRENYNDYDKLPKMLPCHHTFCLDCLMQMFRVEGEYRQTLTSAFRGMPMAVKIQCPSCREGIIVSEAELRRLPSDHTITELVCFVKSTGKTDVQYCSKHQLQPLNFFCEPCIQPVCCDCTVIDHKEKAGHLVINVDEAMKKYKPKVEETIELMKKDLEELVEKQEAISKSNESLEQIQTELNRQIKSTFDRIRETLDEREKELFDSAENEIQKKGIQLEKRRVALADRETEVATEVRGLDDALKEKNISFLFTGHKEAQKVLNKTVHIPPDTTNDFSVSFQFNSRQELTIRQQLNNFGEIVFTS